MGSVRPVRLFSVIAAVAAGWLLGGCGQEREPGQRPDARSTAVPAAQRTLDAGPSAVIARVRSGAVRYRMVGRLDPGGGYRLCAVVVAAPGGLLVDRSLWLEGHAGSSGTLTGPGRRCAPEEAWTDDHPPTLQLYRGRHLPPPGSTGAEDFLHATLLALTRLDFATVSSTRRCGTSDCLRAVVDFAALAGELAYGDEDGWTLRPLLQSLARHPVTLRVAADGYLDRIALVAPDPAQDGDHVTVSLDLSNYGRARPVPRVRAFAIE